MRSGHVTWGAISVAAVTLAAVVGAAGDAPPTSASGPSVALRQHRPAATTTAPTTTAPTTAAPSSAAPSTAAPSTTVPANPTEPSASTSAPTTAPVTTTSTATTEVPTTTPSPSTTEPAQRRRADPPRTHPTLPPPAELFEPGPPWAGEAALTGLAIDESVTARPALVVKIDNAPGGRPQWNLADADLVIEENVEEITRFVAVYHSRLPDRIGPVRSVRTTDLDLLSALDRPVLAWSGGNPGVTAAVRDWEAAGLLVDLSAQRSGCYYRSRTRSAPHNLVLDPLCALESATTAGPARPLFERDTGEPATWSGTPTDRFEVRMDGLTVTWVWDPGSQRYLRRQRGDWHTDVDGDVVSATNVLVMTVPYVPSVIDARSPHAITTGWGPAVLHRGGVAIAGSWWRDDARNGFVLWDDEDTVLTLSPGTVFVELVR